MTLCRPLFWLATLGLLAGPGAAARADLPTAAEVGELVCPLLADRPFQAVVVGIAVDGADVVYGFGRAKIGGELRTPDANTVFEIGSITKCFTGILLADRVKAGVVKLDDPAEKHLPEGLKLPRRDDRDITLLQLATHTSGLPRMPPLFFLGSLLGPSRDTDNPYKHYSLKILEKELPLLRIDRPIGGKSAYSNLGAGVLGHALVHASKAESYERLLSERVLAPLGMSDTGITLSESQRKRFIAGFNDKGKRAPGWEFGCLEGAGALRSTARDMLVFARANLGGAKEPLKSALAFAREPWRETGPDRGVGLGWQLEKGRKSKEWRCWHNGGTGGYRSFLGIATNGRAAVVVLGNSGRSVDEIGGRLLQRLDGEK